MFESLICALRPIASFKLPFPGRAGDNGKSAGMPHRH